MSILRCSATNSILFALSILPILVNGYDCRLGNGDCSQGGSSSLIGYSICMVRRYSVSVFIQCASQKDTPDFTAKDDDGGTTNISPIDILTNALTSPACSVCNLARNLQKAADEHGSIDFATYLCNQYHPVNAGICCLRNCLMVMPVEHSIGAFCAGDKRDLMDVPTLPESCGADSSGGSGGGGASDNTGGNSNNNNSPSTEEVISSSVSTTQSSLSSTMLTTSPTANTATPTSGTSTGPTTQATPSTGAASRRRMTYTDELIRLGLGVLAILAVF